MIHTETYRIRNYEADANGHLWLSSLANYLQDAADRHAIDLGVGLPQLLKQGLSWVLHRMVININRWPRIPEELTITTHPSGEERVYIYRDYYVYDSDHNLLITASSTWLVFDMAKRKLTSPSLVMKQLFEPYHQLPHLLRPSGKYPDIPEKWQYRSQVTARHNEIDRNQHVNNSVYFQWLLEAIPANFLTERICNSIEITFKTECNWGEAIWSQCASLENDTFMHRLENIKGEEIVTAVSKWNSL